jgi:hypothetical protein
MISEKSMLLALLDEAFDKKSWHGPNLRGAIRGVTPAVCHLIRGAAAHDLYHAGQIRLLRRMCGGSSQKVVPR